jgi:hypothetical protein
MFKNAHKRKSTRSSEKTAYLRLRTEHHYLMLKQFYGRLFGGNPFYPLVTFSLCYFAFANDNSVGVPHATSSNDTYEGHFIPKGTLFLSIKKLTCNVVYQERPSYVTPGQIDSLQVSRY